MINPVAIKVGIPENWKIHLVFHISLLKSAVAPLSGQQIGPPEAVEVNREEEYEVQRIVGHRSNRMGLSYFASWKGYGLEDRSWVQAWNVHAPRLVRAYWRRRRKRVEEHSSLGRGMR